MSEVSWGEVVKRFPEANFLQSPEYQKMNEILGQKVYAEDFDGNGWAIMTVRDAKRGRYLEIPCGPLIDWNDKKIVKLALERIAAVARQEKCVFVRIRPQLLATPENLTMLEGLGLKKSPMHLAAEHTVIINLDKTEDELLANMRRQTRYEVRQAIKQGIKVTSSNDEAIFKGINKTKANLFKESSYSFDSLPNPKWNSGEKGKKIM